MAKKRENIAVGVAHVYATFNNTIVTFTTITGDVIAAASAGSSGFKGARKCTPYAAQVAAEKASAKAMTFGMKIISVKVRGPGAGRESAIRALVAAGLNVTEITDVTGIPHNGCKRRKAKRL